jgi:uncharacterized membrane protein
MAIDYSSLSATLLSASVTLWLISSIYSYGIKDEFLNIIRVKNKDEKSSSTLKVAKEFFLVAEDRFLAFNILVFITIIFCLVSMLITHILVVSITIIIFIEMITTIFIFTLFLIKIRFGKL